MAEAHPSSTSRQNPQRPVTLAIDIGGTGLKIMALDAAAKPITQRLRTETPIGPTPLRVLNELEKLRAEVPEFDRVSAGFPGVIKNGHTLTAANLHPEWVGVELVLTLGTGMGSALFTRGRLAPGLELGHHPFRKGREYEEFLGRRGLKEYGPKKWNKILQKAIEQTARTFNWDSLYLGGGNAKLVNFPLPPNVSLVSNQDGLLGGIKLWADNDD